MQTDGGRVHYLDSGRRADPRPTLLFVHGNPTWSFHWRRLLERFRDSHRVVAIDHLGCGLSDVQARPLRLADHIDNLAQLCDLIEPQRTTLVAQDWGGAIGLGTVLRQRERFERIVLLNTGAFRPWFIPWRIRVCRTPILGKLAVQGFNLFSLAALRMTLSRPSAMSSGPNGKRRLAADVAAGYLAPYDSWSRRGAVYQFVKDIPLSARHPTWQTLGEIEDRLSELASLPALLVWGMRDWCFTPECLDRFAAAWPQAEIHRLADVGHWVVEDAAEEVERIVGDFLARTEAADQ
jgi:haloalkane dehalogenase